MQITTPILPDFKTWKHVGSSTWVFAVIYQLLCALIPCDSWPACSGSNVPCCPVRSALFLCSVFSVCCILGESHVWWRWWRVFWVCASGGRQRGTHGWLQLNTNKHRTNCSKFILRSDPFKLESLLRSSLMLNFNDHLSARHRNVKLASRKC